MAGKLIVDTLEPAVESGTVQVNGPLEAASLLGSIKPMNKTWKRTLTDTTVTYTPDTIDFGLGNTNAKYILATVFSYSDYSGGDLSFHVFGSNIPNFNTGEGFKVDHYNFDNESEDNSYVSMILYGGTTSYNNFGISQFMIIPLKSDKTFDARLGYDYEGGTCYIKIRTIGYVE